MIQRKWTVLSARSRGFTLIELMIVVVVIGILATIGAANFSSARQRSIDAAMKSDLHHAMTALEDYRIQMWDLPAAASTFAAITGFPLSPGVRKSSWSRPPRKRTRTMPSVMFAQ